MTTKMYMYHADRRLEHDYKDGVLEIEVYPDDNTVIEYEYEGESFTFEIEREDAIRMANIILKQYEDHSTQ